MKSAGKARNNGLYRHIRTSKEIIRNLLNDSTQKVKQLFSFKEAQERAEKEAREKERQERIKARRNKRGMER